MASSDAREARDLGAAWVRVFSRGKKSMLTSGYACLSALPLSFCSVLAIKWTE